MNLVYYFSCALTAAVALLAEKKNSKLSFWFSVILVSCISGLRASTVGIDTGAYYQYIEWARMGVLEHVEIGFLYTTRFLLFLCDSAKFVIFVFSSAISFCVLFRFWTLRKQVSYGWSVFLYLALYFQFSMNIMRQFLAIAIVFLGTYFLQNKRYSIFIVTVIIGSSFHYSAFIGLAILLIFGWTHMKNGKLRYAIAISFMAMLPIAYYIVFEVWQRYSGYFDNPNPNIGMMIFAKIALLFLFVIFNLNCFSKKNASKSFYANIFAIYAVGLICTFAGYIYDYMDRVGLYFMMFEPICLAIMCKKRYSILFKIAVLLLSVYVIYSNYRSNGHGIFPYDVIFRDILQSY